MTEVNGELKFEERQHPELGPTHDEWTMVETRQPGVLVAMMRQQQHGHFHATAKSFDYGKTWTPWRLSNVYIGCIPARPMLKRMPNGTLLLCYGQRWIGRTFVVPSHDNGETWDIAHRQTILHSPTEYHASWDSHYTDIAQAEGKMWLAVDYIASPARGSLKGLYGTFINTDYFRDVHAGLMLDSTTSVVTHSTKGWWQFDELDGQFARDGVCANYGEIHGARRVPGRMGNALSFDGNDDYMMVYDDASLWLPKYFSREAWINTPDATKDQTIISKAPRYTLCLKDGKLCLEIGRAIMIAEMKTPLPSNRWVHVAVSYCIRQSYSRAIFYVDGKEDSWAKTGKIAETYAQAVASSDTHVAGGSTFQEGFYRKNVSADNIVIGMDNDLNGRPLHGLIDEVAIHSGAFEPAQIARSVKRRFLSKGHLTSQPIVQPRNTDWKRFQARTTTPDGTAITFHIEDAAGQVLMRSVAAEADISRIDADTLVLRAELTSDDTSQTPVLHQWSLSCHGDVPPRLVRRPLPKQTAAESK